LCGIWRGSELIATVHAAQAPERILRKSFFIYRVISMLPVQDSSQP
jgi:hypothetical protein